MENLDSKSFIKNNILNNLKVSQSKDYLLYFNHTTDYENNKYLKK